MTLPSDVDPDVSEAMERVARPAPREPRNELSLEQKGLIAAAVVAFLGIAYIGPAITRMTRKPTPRERLARRVQEARWEANKAGARVRARARRLAERAPWR